MPLTLGVSFHKVLKMLLRSIACYEPLSKVRLSQPGAVPLLSLLFRSTERGRSSHSDKVGKGGKELELDHNFWKRLFHVCDPFKALVSRSSSPTLEGIRRPSRETVKLKYSTTDEKQKKWWDTSVRKIELRGSSLTRERTLSSHQQLDLWDAI